MRDRHKLIENDTRLLKQIYKEVESKLAEHKGKTRLFLVGKFAFYFLITSASYAGIWYFDNGSAVVTSYVLFGLSAVLFGFNFAHDFCHNTVLKSKRLNNLSFTALYTLVGAHAEAWKYRHIHSHHYAPNVKDYDTDLQITGLIRIEPRSEHQWYHRFQHLYAPFAYSSYSFYWVFVKDYVIYFTNPHEIKQDLVFHLSFWTQKVFYMFYLLVLPLLFAGQHWTTILLGFVLMHLLQSVFLLFTFFITHHVERTHYFSADEEGYINISWVMNQIRSSNDFYPFSETANFVFGGFNNHIAHHLFPHIHHVHYPRLNRILYRILREHSIEPNVTGFFSGVVSHLRYLRRMSISPALS